MAKVSLAVVGAGTIAQSVHLPVLRRLRGVEVVAICDRNLSKARAVAQRFDIPIATRSLDELLQLPINAVDICTSTDTHTEIATACIEAGMDILVERPLARSSTEALGVVERARQRGVKLMVGMNHRFRSDVVLMKNYIEQEQLGQLYYAKTGWLKPYSGDDRLMALAAQSGHGVLFELGLVLIDLLLYTRKNVTVQSVSASLFYNTHPTVEDVAIATLNLSDGSVASLEASWSLVRPDDLFYCNVYGKRGSAFINPFKVVQQSQQGTTIRTAAEHHHSKIELYTKSYEAELKHFVAAVQGLVPVISTGEEALKLLNVIEALYRSAQERTEVPLSRTDAVAA